MKQQVKLFRPFIRSFRKNGERIRRGDCPSYDDPFIPQAPAHDGKGGKWEHDEEARVIMSREMYNLLIHAMLYGCAEIDGVSY